MAKTCIYLGCTYPVFSHAYCRSHQWCRKDDKYKPYRYVKKPTGEKEVFESIWKTRPHKSFLTGHPLDFFNVSYFAHILSKGKYPKYRLKRANIILLTVEEHFLLDQGTSEQREMYERIHNCNFETIYKLKQKLLESYE